MGTRWNYDRSRRCAKLSRMLRTPVDAEGGWLGHREGWACELDDEPADHSEEQDKRNISRTPILGRGRFVVPI